MDILLSIGASLGLFFLAWVITARLKDLTPLDAFWGLAPVLASWVGALADGSVSLHEGLMAALVTAWGVRLAIYLTARWRAKGAEDSRYARMRANAASGFVLRSLLTVVALQAALSLLVILPVYGALTFPAGPVTALGWVFVGVAGGGLLIETLADWQLSRFKSRPENTGRLMRSGLWAHMRHPNYAGEILFWSGSAGLAASFGAWWAFASPVLVAFLLYKVSGIPLLKRSMRSRYADYADYARTTSAFGLPRLRRRVG